MSQTVSPARLNLEALARALADHQLALAGPLRAEMVSGGRSNLTYRVTDGRSRWVLRRPPLGTVLPGTHDMGREHRVIAALGDTVVPVPRVVLLVTDRTALGAPFYLMEEVDGLVLRERDQVAALSPDVRRDLSCSMVDTLVDLHRLDSEAVGLGDLGRPEGYLKRQVDRWIRQYHAVQVRPLPLVDRIGRTLRATVPRSELAAVIHGDYRLDNVIVRADEPQHIAAVLDWEMATLGDPLADLATLVMFWDETEQPHNPISGGLTALPGFFSRDEVIERYIARMGLQVDNVDWYLVFAQFRLAVILEQIHARGLADPTASAAYDGVADMVPEILDRAAADIEASTGLRDAGSGP